MNMDKNYLLHKWLNDEATTEEFEILKNDPEYASYIKIAEASEEFSAPDMDMQANFKAISAKTKPVRSLSKNNSINTLWKVAAVLAVILGVYFYSSSTETLIESDIAQTQIFQLPDNSKVILNAASKLSYNKSKWKKERLLNLEGEAYFDVTKGETFSVKTTEGIIKVLGTEFNVFMREDLLSVTCYEGLVSVSFDDKTIKLPAGQKLQIEDGKLIFQKDITVVVPDWLAEESSFENAQLSIVLQELENQYAIDLNMKQPKSQKRFTGSFTHKNLKMALKSICEPLQLDFEIHKNGSVSIYDKK